MISRIRRWGLGLVIALAFSMAPSEASLDGAIDYSNDRIVPLFTNPDWIDAQGSGFLYSSRIVLTAAHTAFSFDANGNRVEFRAGLSVGLPNANINKNKLGVRVIKRFSAPGYLAANNPDLNDFSVLVLEKDLIEAEPAALLTPEIEAELLEKRAEVQLHGYGNIVDLCAANEPLPCKTNNPQTSAVPRAVKATLQKYEDFSALVGYVPNAKFANQLLFFTPGKSSMCGGDSGGSLTTTYNGKLLYLANIGTAFNIYACGQSRTFDGKGGINYSQPIYRYLDLIKAAEAYVAEQIAIEKAAQIAATPTPTPTKASTSTLTNKVKSTTTCVKNKQVKVLQGANAKCPKGYTKK